MVVDDDLNHLSLVDSYLTPIGFSVLQAPNAETALEMLNDITPELFILDIDMPGMDGWELAQRLRTGFHATTPIVMISGHASDAQKPMAQSVLCDAFIAKPYNLDDLLLRIGDLLKIDLTMAPHPEPEPPAPHLTDADRDALIALVDLGHIKAVRDHLDVLERTGRISPDLCISLRRRADQFDLSGLKTLIERADREPV
jgi:CheY-like chemotaxis protein